MKNTKAEVKLEVVNPTIVKIGREEAFIAEEEPKKLNKLDLTFNQEDLNKLRDKVNEIVDRLNN